jgi:WD40 repeat protein
VAKEPEKAQPIVVKPDRLPTPTPALVVDRLRTARTRQLTISTGGRWAIVLSDDNVVQVFDAAHGRLVMEKSLRPYTVCKSNPFSPDGRRVLVRSKRKIKLLNLWTGEVIRSIKIREKGPRRCTLSGNGRRIVLAQKGRIWVYDLTQEAPMFERETPVTRRLKAVLADEDAKTLVVAGWSKSKPIIAVFGGEGGPRWRRLVGVQDLGNHIISPNGRWLSGKHGTLGSRVWALWTGRPQHDFSRAQVLDFLNNQNQVVVATDSGEVQLFDIEEHAQVASIQTFAGLRGAAVSADGQRLVAAGGNKDTHLFGRWDVQDGQHRFKRSSKRHGVVDLNWSRDGRFLMVVLKGAGLSVVERQSSQLHEAPPPSPGERVSLPGGPFRSGQRWRGRWLPKFYKRDIALIDDGAGRLKWSHRLKDNVLAFDVSSDAGHAVALDRSGEVSVFSTSTGSIQKARPLSLESKILALTTHPSEAKVLVFRADGQFCTQDLRGLQVPQCQGLGGQHKRALIAVSAGGNHVVVATRYRLSILAGAGAYELKRKIAIPYAKPRRASLSPDGGRVALSDGIDIRIWDSLSGKGTSTIIFPAAGTSVVLGRNWAVESGANPYLRWRKGFDLIPRNSDAIALLRHQWLRSHRPL